MTDTVIRLPDDIIQFIASNHFTIPEFLNFRLISKEYNQAITRQDFLLPLYKILYSLNKSLPLELPPETAILEFIPAFKTTKERQNEEIAFFNSFYPLPDDIHRPLINRLLKTPNQTLAEMSIRDELLNNLNQNIIDLAILQNEEEEGLTLTGITRFVYSPENADYLKNLKFLTLSDCSVTVLDLEDYTEIQEIRCVGGKLIVLNVKGCLNLKELICNQNKIKFLNIEGCSAVEKINCDDNQITSLDLSERLLLKGVRCENNHLLSLIAVNCRQLSWMHLARNPKLTNLNLHGCTKLQRVVKDDKTNSLVELNIGRTPLEHKAEWQGLKQRVMLRDSSRQLKKSSEKEMDLDCLSEKFSQMSIYTPSFRKENSFSLLHSQHENKERVQLRRHEKLR